MKNIEINCRIVVFSGSGPTLVLVQIPSDTTGLKWKMNLLVFLAHYCLNFAINCKDISLFSLFTVTVNSNTVILWQKDETVAKVV